MTPEAPRPVPARRGFSLHYRNTQLLSKIDPLHQAERIVASLDSRPQNLYFCPSPLLGYGLEQLLARTHSSSAILCVESDPQLHKLSREALLPLLDANPSRIALAPPDITTPEEILAFLESIWPPRRFRRVISLKTNRGWSLDSARYTALEETVRTHIYQAWQNTITLLRLGQRYTSNLIRNLPLISVVPALSSTAVGTRDILALGAGPGLDALLDQLQAEHPAFGDPTKRHFSIFCVDTALRPLLERGIRPDAVLALEAQYWNLLDFIGTGTLPLILDLASHYATWRVCTKDTPPLTAAPQALVSTQWAPLQLFTRLEGAGLLPSKIPPLGSVGLSLVQLALTLTRGRVIIAGLDFAFSADSFHAKGTSHGLMHESSTNRLTSLFRAERAFRQGVHHHPDKNGFPILSDPALEGYRNLFKSHFAHENRILDAGEKGLDLGIPRVSGHEAGAILFEEKNFYTDSFLCAQESGRPVRPKAAWDTIHSFILTEQRALEDLRDILTGQRALKQDELVAHIDALDYLWAHFAEYQGTRSSAELASDQSFLKRLRAGIDRNLKDWMIAARSLEALKPVANGE